MSRTRRAAGRHRAGALAGATAVAAGIATIAVATLPFFRFAYQAPDLRAVVETVNAVVALLVGYLVYGRLRRGQRWQDLLLGMALATVAVANLVLTAVPAALTLGPGGNLSQWAPLVVRLVGTVLLVCAALASTRRRVQPTGALLAAAGLVACLVAVAASGLAWGDLLPRAVDPRLVGDAARPLLVAHPVVLGVQGLEVVLYATAAVAFARQADRTGDELIRWVAAGCVLASFARVHYLLYPSLYSDLVYTGDLLRLGFYLFMLVGASREITRYWQTEAQAAVLDDRRRLARDLHDGLIQELSYIVAQSHRLAAAPGDTVAAGRIAGAAGRAVDESRRALAALTRPTDEPFPTVLRRAAQDLAERYDVKVVATVDPVTDVDEPMAEALLRITAEAVRNAVRHGQASRIDVALDAEPLSLTVADDGRGFDVNHAGGGRQGGFGLTSMRERAEGVGGTLTIESTPGEGTTVRVTWA
jgi:signal transduction histidine kinase